MICLTKPLVDTLLTAFLWNLPVLFDDIFQPCRYSGPTVHFVDEQFDTGRTLAQRVVPVLTNDTPEQLAARVLHEVCLMCSWGFPSSCTLNYYGYLRFLNRQSTIDLTYIFFADLLILCSRSTKFMLRQLLPCVITESCGGKMVSHLSEVGQTLMHIPNWLYCLEVSWRLLKFIAPCQEPIFPRAWS